jgi:hypothetical protein
VILKVDISFVYPNCECTPKEGWVMQKLAINIVIAPKKKVLIYELIRIMDNR